MDDFFNPAEAAPVVDPAADFLAGDMASVPNITSEFTVEEVTMPTDSPVDLSAEFAELENMEVMNEDDLRKMTVQGDESSAGISEKVDPSAMYSGISLADDRINQLQAESPAVREWRETYAKRIQDADNKENTETEEWKQSAKTATEEFYKTYEAENSKRKNQNKSSAIASVIPDPASKEKAWSQIGDFINFQAQRAAKTTDKERMKSLLFQLKNSPPVGAK